MIEFQLTKTQFSKMLLAFRRRQLLKLVPSIYGPLWIVGWILFAISGGDAWSTLGTVGLLLIITVPIQALVVPLRIVSREKRFAEANFLSLYSLDGHDVDIGCQLEDGKVVYHNLTRDVLYTINLKSVKKVGKFKGFFTLELSRRQILFVPLNSETENIYNEICQQRSALKNK